MSLFFVGLEIPVVAACWQTISLLDAYCIKLKTKAENVQVQNYKNGFFKDAGD